MKGADEMLGEFSLFSWKSKEVRAREQEDYEKWALPYGQKQRDNLSARLLEAFPKESAATTLIPFWTCKELYETALKKQGSQSAAINYMINDLKKYKRIVSKKTMPMYLAFVLADAEIDENAVYPPVEKLKARAEELEALRQDTRQRT